MVARMGGAEGVMQEQHGGGATQHTTASAMHGMQQQTKITMSLCAKTPHDAYTRAPR